MTFALTSCEQMRSDDHTAFSHGADEGIEKEHLLSSECAQDASSIEIEIPRGYTASLQCIAIAVIALLFINVCCSLVAMRQLQLASRVLKQLLNYADNRDLPRPDPYDGL